MANKELSGKITVDLDRQPAVPIPDDAARLQLVTEQTEITSEEDYRRMCDVIKIAVDRITAVENEFASDKKTTHSAWASVCARIKRWTDPYRLIREKAEVKVKAYLLGLESAKVEQEKALEEEASGAKQELLDRAKAARRQGDIKAARDLEEQANSVMEAITIPSQQPEVEGISDRRPWTAKIENPLELVVAVAEGRVKYLQTVMIQGREVEEPILLVNERIVNALAKKLQNSLRLPGVKAVQEISIAVRKSK